jgi:hypothetical protein
MLQAVFAIAALAVAGAVAYDFATEHRIDWSASVVAALCAVLWARSRLRREA